MAEQNRNEQARLQRNLARERERRAKEREIRERTVAWPWQSKGETGWVDRRGHNIRNLYRRWSDSRPVAPGEAVPAAGPVPATGPAQNAEPAARGPEDVEEARRRLQLENPQEPALGAPAENLAANDPNPAIRQLAADNQQLREQLNRMEAMMRGGTPGAVGVPGGLNAHPGWMIHPGWSQGPAGVGYAPYAGPGNAPGQAPAARPAENLAPVRQQVEEAARRLEATAPAPATPEQHRNAATTLSGRTKADVARFVAENAKDDPSRVQRWMSAMKRWPVAVFSGLFSGMAGYSAGYGMAANAAMLGVPTTWMASLGTISLPLFGAVTLPALPIILAGMAGVAAWQLIGRPVTGLKELDELANKGWQAKKLMKEMKWAEKKGYNPDAAKIYERLRTRPTWRRMETVPRIFGAILGGGIAADYWTGSSVVKNTAIGTYELGKGGGKSLWEWVKNPSWPSWLTSGTSVTPDSGITDHERALATLKSYYEEELTAKDFTRAGEVNRLSADLESESEARWSAVNEGYKLARENFAKDRLIGSLGETLNSNTAQIADLQQRLSDASVSAPPGGESAAPRPRVLPDASAASPGVVPDTGLSLLDKELLGIEESLHVGVDDRGIWAIRDILEKKLQAAGIDDPNLLRWLTDAYEDYTQDGTAPQSKKSRYLIEGLLDKISGKSGVTQITIPSTQANGVPNVLRTEYLFGNDTVHNDVLRRISQTPNEILNPTMKSRLSAIVKDLNLDAMKLITGMR